MNIYDNKYVTLNNSQTSHDGKRHLDLAVMKQRESGPAVIHRLNYLSKCFSTKGKMVNGQHLCGAFCVLQCASRSFTHTKTPIIL